MNSPYVKKERLLEKKKTTGTRLKEAEKQRAFIRRDPYKFNKGVFDDYLLYNALSDIAPDLWESIYDINSQHYQLVVKANGCIPEIYKDCAKEFPNWKEATTDNNWIMPVLDFDRVAKKRVAHK